MSTNGETLISLLHNGTTVTQCSIDGEVVWQLTVPPVNLIDNGVNYENWEVVGTGSTKGASGIHLADSTYTEHAVYNYSGFEPNKLYILRLNVTVLSSDSVTILNNLSGSYISPVLTLGMNDILIMTQSEEITNKNIQIFLSDNSSTQSVDFEVVGLFEAEKYAVTTTPKLVMTFDDGWDSQYTKAFAYMQTKSQKGTAYIVPSDVGTSGRLTEAQCSAMAAAGWCIANHTYDHAYMGSYSKAAAKSTIEQGMNYLTTHGFTTGVHHLCFPGGQYNDDVLSAASELGVKTARTIEDGLNGQVVPDLYKIKALIAGGGAYTLAQLQDQIDSALSSGKTCFLLFHRLVDTAGEVGTDGMNFLYSDFQTLCDWIATQSISVLTVDEWYNSLTIVNP